MKVFLRENNSVSKESIRAAITENIGAKRLSFKNFNPYRVANLNEERAKK